MVDLKTATDYELNEELRYRKRNADRVKVISSFTEIKAAFNDNRIAKIILMAARPPYERAYIVLIGDE